MVSLALPLSRWQPAASAYRAGEWQNLLLSRGSLTEIIRSASVQAGHDGFAVKLLRQELAMVSHDEAQALGWRQPRPAVIREVLLQDHQQGWVFAHSVLPLSTLTGKHSYLGRMGSRPLGSALFSDPTVCRGDMQMIKLRSQDRLYVQATAGLADKPASLWGRRSVFWVGNKPLLVAEFFLSNPAKC